MSLEQVGCPRWPEGNALLGRLRSDHTSAIIATVRRRSGPAVLVVSVAAVLAASAPASEAEDAGTSKRIGPIVTVASDSHWTLRAWQSTDGLCISYRPPAGVNGCHVRLPPRSSLFSFLGSRGKPMLVIGAIAPTVVRVEVKDKRGHFSTRIYKPSRALKTRLNFFRVLVRTGSPPNWRISAYNEDGKEVGFVGQGRLS